MELRGGGLRGGLVAVPEQIGLQGRQNRFGTVIHRNSSLLKADGLGAGILGAAAPAPGAYQFRRL